MFDFVFNLPAIASLSGTPAQTEKQAANPSQGNE
jgi:hypothetical protein